MKGLALKSNKEEMATFKGDWIRWFSYVCNYTIQNVEDFYKCVNTKMYRKEEIIFKAAEFSFATAQMSDVSLQWESFIDSLAHGTCQRLKNNGNMADGTYLKIFLNSSILYRIYIHDPNCIPIREMNFFFHVNKAGYLPKNCEDLCWRL